MSNSPAPPSTPAHPAQHNESQNLGDPIVRNLVAALIAALSAMIGGVGGASIKGDTVPVEVRQTLEDIRVTLGKMDERNGGRDKEFERLEDRVERVESDVKALQLKPPR